MNPAGAAKRFWRMKFVVPAVLIFGVLLATAVVSSQSIQAASGGVKFKSDLIVCTEKCAPDADTLDKGTVKVFSDGTLKVILQGSSAADESIYNVFIGVRSITLAPNQIKWILVGELEIDSDGDGKVSVLLPAGSTFNAFIVALNRQGGGGTQFITGFTIP